MSEITHMANMEKILRNCPGAQFGYSDEDGEFAKGFYFYSDGCDPVEASGETLAECIKNALIALEDDGEQG